MAETALEKGWNTLLDRLVDWAGKCGDISAALDGPRKSFAHYDEAEVKRALWNTMELFRVIAKEVAARIGYRYPSQSDEHATRLTRTYVGVL